jgi:hypothetical protein
MGPITRKLLCSFAFTTFLAGSGFASPLNSKLLPLVPPGAEIVAGFENHPDAYRHGQLVLSTHSDRLDLDDWQALTGVDAKRSFEEVIEVAASVPGRGMLSEHMVLVAGHFDKDRIFRAAEVNGSQRADCDGQTVMLIEPFAREKDEMQSTRWMTILDNRIGMLGTPFLVQSALQRYLANADIDMPLRERLSQLRRDDTSWNVLVWSPRVLTNYTVALSTSAWGRLLEDAEVLMVGARFGPRVRVDFSLHAGSDRGREFFRQKAELFAEVFAAGPPAQAGAFQSRGLNDLALESDQVQGSIELSSKQFEDWGSQASRPHVYLVPRGISHGE